MKKILLLVVAICSVLTVVAQTPRQLSEFKQVSSGNGTEVWQERTNSKKLNGKYHLVKNEQTYYLVTFKDGLQNGPEECYKYNMLASRSNYALGFQCGEMEEYGTSGESRGKLIKKCNYNNQGRLDGQCTTFFSNGSIQSVCTYSDGRLVGDEYHYYPDGKVFKEFHIYEKDGKTYKSFSDRGNEHGVEFTEEYMGVLGSDGWLVNKVGEYKETWHTGQLKTQEFYTDKGAKTGIWKEWFIDGKLKSETCYEALRNEKTFFKSGSLATERQYNKEGDWTAFLTYYENGKLREETRRKDGTIITKQYYDDGKLREEYTKNAQYEVVKEYHRNGQLRMAKEKNGDDYRFKITECYDDKGTSIPFVVLEL